MKKKIINDPINPGHYKRHPSGLECIEVTRHFGFNLGNVVKYVWRADAKGAPVEDLKKARWYLDDEIRRRERATAARRASSTRAATPGRTQGQPRRGRRR
jgi:hypothetical protein